jgi:tetratricopeptide (TPR) repeat protein
MDALPGYMAGSVDEPKPIDKNPILLEGALTSEPRSKKTVYSKGLFFLVMVLFFLGIGYYGLVYYQAQNEALENSMRKYALAKMDISSLKVKPKTAEKVDVKTDVSATTNEVSVESLSQGKKPSEIDDKKDSQIDAAKEDVVVPGHNDTIDVKSGAEPKQVSVQPIFASKSDAGSRHTSAQVNVKRVSRPSARAPVSKRVLVVDNSGKTFLAEAYSAYESGQLGLAETKFTQVLSIDSKNITALLGLGGIAASQNQPRVAMKYYQQALEVKPESLVVYEAIANLSSNIELNSEWNDSLKKMVNIYPNSAILQYALGNLYSSNNDWLAAQECYFKAFAEDMNNPDFMVNLAVSLDHLGKYPLAAQYYTRALALEDSQEINFDVYTIKNRLIAIRQFIAQEK